ncbi:MAG: hypothetical protein RL385_5706 [Pseudomonadota bacterium]|jgi:two-component system NtrC family response regulator
MSRPFIASTRPTRTSETREISELIAVRTPPRAVLVVEPDPEVQSRLASALGREGHRVVGTGSGEGAMALIDQWDVDLALVSDSLPGRSGLEIARLIRQRRPQTTVLIMTEHVEPSTRVAVRAIGAHDCVRKPLDVDAIRAWLCAPVGHLGGHEAVAQ